MGVLLDDGKYQVMESLLAEDGYSASVCIDVETRNDYREYVFNIYSEPLLISAFLPIYHSLMPGVCGDFRDIRPGSGCIMAVFDYHKGIPLESYLESLKKDDYPARAQAVGMFFDAAIVLDALPPIFAVSAFSPPYTVFDQKEGAVRFNYIIKPREQPSADEIREAFVPYLESAFIKNRYLPELATEFLLKVRNGEIKGFVPICSAWRRISADALAEYEGYKKESFFKYLRRRASKEARKKAKQLKQKKSKKRE